MSPSTKLFRLPASWDGIDTKLWSIGHLLAITGTAWSLLAWLLLIIYPFTFHQAEKNYASATTPCGQEFHGTCVGFFSGCAESPYRVVNFAHRLCPPSMMCCTSNLTSVFSPASNEGALLVSNSKDVSLHQEGSQSIVKVSSSVVDRLQCKANGIFVFPTDLFDVTLHHPKTFIDPPRQLETREEMHQFVKDLFGDCCPQLLPGVFPMGFSLLVIQTLLTFLFFLLLNIFVLSDYGRRFVRRWTVNIRGWYYIWAHRIYKEQRTNFGRKFVIIFLPSIDPTYLMSAITRRGTTESSNVSAENEKEGGGVTRSPNDATNSSNATSAHCFPTQATTIVQTAEAEHNNSSSSFSVPISRGGSEMKKLSPINPSPPALIPIDLSTAAIPSDPTEHQHRLSAKEVETYYLAIQVEEESRISQLTMAQMCVEITDLVFIQSIVAHLICLGAAFRAVFSLYLVSGAPYHTGSFLGDVQKAYAHFIVQLLNSGAQQSVCTICIMFVLQQFEKDASYDGMVKCQSMASRYIWGPIFAATWTGFAPLGGLLIFIQEQVATSLAAKIWALLTLASFLPAFFTHWLPGVLLFLPFWLVVTFGPAFPVAMFWAAASYYTVDHRIQVKPSGSSNGNASSWDVDRSSVVDGKAIEGAFPTNAVTVEAQSVKPFQLQSPAYSPSVLVFPSTVSSSSGTTPGINGSSLTSHSPSSWVQKRTSFARYFAVTRLCCFIIVMSVVSTYTLTMPVNWMQLVYMRNEEVPYPSGVYYLYTVFDEISYRYAQCWLGQLSQKILTSVDFY